MDIPPPPPPPHPGNPDPTVMPSTQSQMASPLAARGTKVDVRLSCRGLVGLDPSPPSSFAVVFHKTSGKSDWREISRSETSRRNADPDYRRIFQIEYRFELYQELRIVIFDRSTESENLQHHSLIGVADCTLGKIVSARSASLEINLINIQRSGESVGTVLLHAEEILSAKKMITIEMSVAQLMSEEQTSAQNAYLESLKTQANAPIDKPQLQRRGPAVIVNRFRKEPKQPAVLPAHLENQVQKEVLSRAAVHQEIQKIVTAPPPFVPFLTIMRAPKSATAALDWNSPDIQWEEVHKSTQIKDYTDLVRGIKLEPFTLSEYDLTEGDESRLLKIAIVQSQSGDSGKIVGQMVTNFPALKRTCTNAQDPTLRLQPTGVLTIQNYSEEVQPSFMEYLKGGWCDFGLVCAVDFTSSNGDPRRPGTRHYNPVPGAGPVPPNEYEAAMRTVGNMLSSYSSDSRIPAYGFGANLPPSYDISHCFPVTEYELGDPYCNGVDGLVRAYQATLSRVQLYGPTIFSEVLRTVGTIVSRRAEAAARAGNASLAYTVLLILTDGVISDYDATTAELIKLSALPLSIVIIGVGSEDFGKMHALNSSNGLLRRGAEFALREFVQFVPFQEFRGDLSQMAERVLGGIPDQVLSYVTKVRGEGAPVR